MSSLPPHVFKYSRIVLGNFRRLLSLLTFEVAGCSIWSLDNSYSSGLTSPGRPDVFLTKNLKPPIIRYFTETERSISSLLTRFTSCGNTFIKGCMCRVYNGAHIAQFQDPTWSVFMPNEGYLRDFFLPSTLTEYFSLNVMISFDIWCPYSPSWTFNLLFHHRTVWVAWKRVLR